MKKLIEIAAVDITIYKFVLPLMRELRKSGYYIEVAAQDVGYSDGINKEGFKVHSINMPRNLSPINNIRALFSLIRLFSKEKPSMIHVHTPIASILARIAAKITGVPKVVYTLHGLYNKFPFTQIEKIMCRYFTDLIFTVNQEDRDYLIQKKFKQPERVVNINSVGIDTTFFNPRKIDEEEKKILREELNIKDYPVIGFVGRIIKEKGVIELLEAFIKVREKIPCQLLLVGSAELGERDEETLKIIKRYIFEKELEQYVVLAGHREDIPQLMSIMDVFVLPSYREGMPVSILEAMAMELPVIATNIRGCKEEIDESTGILVPKGDIDSLSKAIEYFLENTNIAIEKGKNARKKVCDLFTVDKSVKIQVESLSLID